MIAVSGLPPARNCTTQPAGLGVPRATSTPDAPYIRRRGWPTARCWWREDKVTMPFLAVRNCTTLPAGPGVSLLAASLPHAIYTLHSVTLMPDCTAPVTGGADTSSS